MERNAMIFCTLSLFLGMALWGSGGDFALTHFLAAHDTPQWNRLWRIVGDMGLGRNQLFVCLGAALYAARHVPHPLYTKLFYMTLGAVYLWLRVLMFKTSPVTSSRYVWQRAAQFCHMLPPVARGWVYAIPIIFGAGAVCFISKIIIGRPRPKMMLWHDTTAVDLMSFNAKFWSFPSGHTTTTFALLAVLHTLFPRWRIPLWGAAITMSLARTLAVTPHYLGDVLAGAALGFGIGLVLCRQYDVKPKPNA